MVQNFTVFTDRLVTTIIRTTKFQSLARGHYRVSVGVVSSEYQCKINSAKPSALQHDSKFCSNLQKYCMCAYGCDDKEINIRVCVGIHAPT